MSETPTKLPRRRRRWLQVSMRTFLVLMMLVALSFGWLGIVVQRGREQRRAVLAIESIGGRISHDKPTNFVQRSEWLRGLLGIDAPMSIRSVTYCPKYPVLEDIELVHLQKFSNLQSLNLGFTRVKDVELVYIKELTLLDCLILRNTGITDAGLVHLRDLPSMEELDVSSTTATDIGLGYLNGMRKMTSLRLNKTLVTDAGLVHLSDLLALK